MEASRSTSHELRELAFSSTLSLHNYRYGIAAFSPSHADEGIELFAHHVLHHHTNGSTGQFAQILPEGLLVRQRRWTMK